MARYYRRRYTRTVVRAPKKKWASNYITLSDNIDYGSNGNFIYFKELASNSTESASPTPIVVKTGNFKVQFDMTLNVAASGAVDARAYIIFVPQGWYLGETSADKVEEGKQLVARHPEWIMAWKQLDFGNANAAGSVDTSVVRMSSRLKRNLNSGDSVYFFVIGNADSTGITTKGIITGACQFWTCAN